MCYSAQLQAAYVQRWFNEPKTDGERRAKALIDQYREAETTKLEREVFAQKKRLADAERTLDSKTKAATESKQAHRHGQDREGADPTRSPEDR